MRDLLAYTVAVVAMLVTMAAAHETRTGWVYPAHCCSNRDCSEIDSRRVRVAKDGYVIDNEFVVLFRNTLRSPDAQYHICPIAGGAPRCFFVPPGVM